MTAPGSEIKASVEERGHAATSEQASAAAAFRRFVELTATWRTAVEADREEFLALLAPFLRNPRHQPHVEMIAAVAFAPRKLLRPMVTFNKLMPFGQREVDRSWFSFRNKAKERENELLAEITLGEVVVDILPVRRAETPSEWAHQQAYMLEARIDIDPPEDLIPASVAVRIVLDEAAAARVLDAFPKSEIAQEAAIVREGEFVESSSSEVTAGLSAKPKGIGASLGAKSASSVQASDKVSVSHNLMAQRIVSATRERVARWEVLKTAEQAPVGGLSFFATILADAECDSLDVTVSAVVEFENWGEAQSQLRRQLPLPKPPSG